MKWYGWVLLIVLGLAISFSTFVIARGEFSVRAMPFGLGMHGGHGDHDGRGHHGIGPLAQWLETSTTQEAGLTAADPQFGEEARALALAVRQERQKLLDILSDPKSTDEQINAQVDQVLAAEAALQRRVTQYVIKARPVLSIPQQQRLLGLYGKHMGGAMAGHHHDIDTVEEVDRMNGHKGSAGAGRPARSWSGGHGGGHHGGH